MSRFSYDNTGKGDKPSLGAKSFVEGLGRPGGRQKAASASTDIPKLGRPGGPQGTAGVTKGGSAPKAARPGSRNPNSAS